MRMPVKVKPVQRWMRKKIQAYFILPVDYRQTLDAHVYYLEQPDSTVYSQFGSLLRYNLLAEQSPEVTRRVLNGPELVLQSTQENRQASNSDWLKIVAPLAAGISLMISVFTSSGYLMSSVVEEKENRTMELLATSASPGQIMGAKISALISVGLTQVLVWSVFPLVVIALAAAYTPFLKASISNGSPLRWSSLPPYRLLYWWPRSWRPSALRSPKRARASRSQAW